MILQALTLNPALFTAIYTGLLNARKTQASVQAALEGAEAYLAERASTVFAPILEHLREAGDARSSSEIEDYFKRHFNVEGVTTACDACPPDEKE